MTRGECERVRGHLAALTPAERAAQPCIGPDRADLVLAGAAILEAVQAARDEVEAVSGRIRGTVILGCTLHTGPLDLAAVLARLRDQHPGVVVQLRQSLAGYKTPKRIVIADRALRAANGKADYPAARASAETALSTPS